MSNTKRALVPIADGSEEMEAVVIIDVLRRAGVEVTVASVSELNVRCSREVRIVADVLIEDALKTEYDVIALPGGMPGADNLRASVPLVEALKKQDENNKLVAAICASPVRVLESAGLVKSRRATAHPGFSSGLPNQEAVNERVVVDGNLITSRGPGTSFEFALELVSQLFGVKKAKEVAEPMVLA